MWKLVVKKILETWWRLYAIFVPEMGVLIFQICVWVVLEIIPKNVSNNSKMYFSGKVKALGLVKEKTSLKKENEERS